MTQLTAEEISALREQHQIKPRWLCGARSYPTVINHGTLKHPTHLEPRSQVCTEPQGHEGLHHDKRHCYQFSLHRFPESQVERYEPEDWSSCSCGHHQCQVTRLLDALEAALDQQPEVDPEDTLAARLALQVTETEEYGIAWKSDNGHSDIQRRDPEYIEAKASRAYGDKIYRRTIINIPPIVGEWEEVEESWPSG